MITYTKQSHDDFLDGFPKMSKVFLKISKYSPIVVRSLDNRFRTFPNIYENNQHFRRRTDDVSTTQEHIQVLFNGLYNHSSGDRITLVKKKNVLLLRVKISCLRARARRLFHRCLYHEKALSYL